MVGLCAREKSHVECCISLWLWSGGWESLSQCRHSEILGKGERRGKKAEVVVDARSLYLDANSDSNLDLNMDLARFKVGGGVAAALLCGSVWGETQRAMRRPEDVTARGWTGRCHGWDRAWRVGDQGNVIGGDLCPMGGRRSEVNDTSAFVYASFLY